LNKNQINSVKIKKIEEECDGVLSLTFNVKNIIDSNIQPMPGQFVMVWVPGVDEVPMSLSGADLKGNWTITVKNVGECTNILCNLSQGDYIGFRGPLGNSFTIPKDKTKLIFLIGGGTGIAPLNFLSKKFAERKLEHIIIEGANKEREIIFINQFESLDHDFSNVIFCTDDGSFGSEGFASTIFKNEIKKYSKKNLSDAIVYTCGPEKMMYEIFHVCEEKKIPMEASLERMMRCGCGLCGLCTLDPLGLLVCIDGPVFNSQILRKIDDFGKFRRDITGRKSKI